MPLGQILRPHLRHDVSGSRFRPAIERLEDRCLLSGGIGALGDAFLVNTHLTGEQRHADVAADRVGNFVVVWQSLDQDGSGWGIYGQRYSRDGAKAGPEFRINTFTTGDQQLPRVAMDNEGNFVVAWQSSGQDGDGLGIYARRYNASGVALGGEFRVNTHTTDWQWTPSVAMDSKGNFVVAWQSYGQDGSSSSIYAQRYSAIGVPLGSEFRVNTHTTGSQKSPSVAMDREGNFVVAWQSYGQDGSSSSVFAQRYHASGVALGSEFRINTHTTGNQWFPSVAMDRAGNFVVAWQSNGQDGPSAGIHAQRYSSGGVPLGSEFRVNTETTGSHFSPSVAMDSVGDFVVAWASWNPEGFWDGIFAQRHNANGTPTGSNFQVNSHILVDLGSPEVAMDAAGNFVVAWASVEQEGSDWDIHARRFAAIWEPAFPLTPLDDYIAANNNATWSVVSSTMEFPFLLHRMDLISQQWRTLAEVDRVDWQHDVSIYVPLTVTPTSALLFIGAGVNSPSFDTGFDELGGQLAVATGMVIVYLPTVPNQLLYFADENFGRVEDALIAYTWDKYLDSHAAGTPDPDWVAQLPMANSAIRTMDMVQEFLATPAGGGFEIEDFILAGGSKRGWTVWLASAAEALYPNRNRVRAAIPIVIDLLNLEESFRHHFESYGFWAPAVQDYVHMGIMDRMGTPELASLFSIVDPLAYKERLTMPKFILNATGDQFFLPDSSQFYFSELVGPKYLRYLPNLDHGLSTSPDLIEELQFLLFAIKTGFLPGEFTWEILGDGTIRVDTQGLDVGTVRMWSATNPYARDFRLETIGAVWTSVTLEPDSAGIYTARPANPEQGWTAFLIEVETPDALGTFHKFTTDVHVLGVLDPPAVADVQLRGTGWNVARDWYSIPAGSADQLKALPWTNVNQVRIVFTGPVEIKSEDLEILGVNVPDYAGLVSGFHYDETTFTATWTLSSAFEADKILLRLADGIVEGGNGLALDGEWANGGSEFPSGNGSAGGSFGFRFNMLPGNADTLGTQVSPVDWNFVRTRLFQNIGDANYTIYADINGDGVINPLDWNGTRARLFSQLPSGDPAAAAALLHVFLASDTEWLEDDTIPASEEPFIGLAADPLAELRYPAGISGTNRLVIADVDAYFTSIAVEDPLLATWTETSSDSPRDRNRVGSQPVKLRR